MRKLRYSGVECLEIIETVVYLRDIMLMDLCEREIDWYLGKNNEIE